MSDGTKSNYTKTGKKVKCIDSGRIDLIYKKVYDVFIDVNGDEFVIDEADDWCYDSLEFPLWIEVIDDTADTTNKVNTTNETKLKFKVGDKVKVVDVKQISSCTDDVKVGYVGVVIEVDEFDEEKPYQVKLDKCYNGWWFTDKCIELVNDDNTIEKEITQIKSDDMVDKANETKRKFSVGDTVKVVDIGYISQATSDIKVGDVGVITYVDSDYVTSPYRVEFDDDYWWFTDKCIELVEDSVNDVNTSNKKYNPLVVQQSGNHYKNGKIQPIEYSERNHLSMCQGNIVKYITRHKEKNGVDDLAKVVHYALLEALFVYGEDGATELRDKVDSLINLENKE